MPRKFWDDAVLFNTDIIPKIPYKVLNFKSPSKILFNNPLEYHHLKVFGCLDFASTRKRNRSKFDPRAKRYVFISYPNGMMAYKLYDLTTHEDFKSRDVVFYVQFFPFDQHNYTLPIILEYSNHYTNYHSTTSEHNSLDETDGEHFA